MRVLALCGSLQAESSNLTLLRLAQARAPAEMPITLVDGLHDLPSAGMPLPRGLDQEAKLVALLDELAQAVSDPS